MMGDPACGQGFLSQLANALARMQQSASGFEERAQRLVLLSEAGKIRKCQQHDRQRLQRGVDEPRERLSSSGFLELVG